MTDTKKSSRVEDSTELVFSELSKIARKIGEGAVENIFHKVSEPIWWNKPFRIVSLLEMLKFYAYDFVTLSREMERAIRISEGNSDSLLTDFPREEIFSFITSLIPKCSEIGLKGVVFLLNETIKEWADKPLSYGQVSQKINNIRSAIETELASKEFFYIDSTDAQYYKGYELFGHEVFEKFPTMSYDIEEAGKCLATNRYTACVFHLMRVMEIGVQIFGKKLKVKLVEEKVWQNILDEVNKAIKNMKPKTPKEKHKQSAYAETASHLFNVKVAWRNRVMHPKDSYTGEQAREVFDHVKTFIHHLSKIV